MSQVEDLTLILVGKTGVGKSATGNMIVGAHEFNVSDSGQSVTSECQVKEAENFGYKLTAVDTPGVMDTGVSSEEAKEKTCKEMIEAIAKCPESGKRAICLVLKYGERFTEENKKSLYILTRVFGEEFLAKFCVIIFTHGDLFDANYEEEGQSFDEWCREQEKDLADLLKECKYRCVLFRNKAKTVDIKKIQVEELIKYVRILDDGYSAEKFTEAKKKHKRLLLEANLTKLLEIFRTKDRLLQQDLDKMTLNELKEEELRALKDKAMKVLNEIDTEDEGVFYDSDELSLLADPRMFTKQFIENCDELIHLAKLQLLKVNIQNDIMALLSKCVDCTPFKCSLETVTKLEGELNKLYEKYKSFGLDFSGGDESVDDNGSEAFMSKKDLSFFDDAVKQFDLVARTLNHLRHDVALEKNRNEIQRKIQSLRRELDAVPSSEISTAHLTTIKTEAESLLLKWEGDDTMTEVLESLRELMKRVDLKISKCTSNFTGEVISGTFAAVSGFVFSVGGVASLSKHIVAQAVSKAAPGVGTAIRSLGGIIVAVVKRGNGSASETT